MTARRMERTYVISMQQNLITSDYTLCLHAKNGQSAWT
jgi:hypothetical protein